MSRSRRTIVVPEPFDASQPADRIALYNEDGSPFGGSVRTADAADQIDVTQLAAVAGDWALSPAFNPLGPLKLEGGRTHQVQFQFEAMSENGDLACWALWDGTADEVISFSQWAAPLDWPTKVNDSWMQNFASGGYYIPAPVDTDLYLLVAASAGDASSPPDGPVHIRNRHLAANPL